MSIRPTPQLIIEKRDGGTLTSAEIEALIGGYVSGEVADYQMAAFAMAVFFQGMDPDEVRALTLAMRDSGEVVDLSGVAGIKVDKHSTGGVGDKVSICLAPMVAACGVPVPMISGRGLGHTGGTLDKLEAIPGFEVDATVAGFRRQVKRLGCALIGQTSQLAPADKRLYALRDVTGTVESIPLITASILSKKLAEGIDGLVLDVKVGRGAFMKNVDDARALARSMVRVGGLAGKKISALLTRMDAPLGRMVGNAVETAEAFELLLGEGQDDLRECTLALGAEMLRVGGVARSEVQARRLLERSIVDRTALVKMEAIVRAQGGDPRVVSEPDRLRVAKGRARVRAKRAGYVRDIDALEVGLTSVEMGAGRARSEDAIDPSLGIALLKKPGCRVKEGDILAELMVHDARAARPFAARIERAFTLGARRPAERPLVIEAIRR